VLVVPRGLEDRAPLALWLIGVGFDDSGESWNALQRAASLAAATGGSVRVILAVTPLKFPPTSPLSPVEAELKLRRWGELATERVVASLSKAVNPDSRLVPGDPGRVLEAESGRGLDLACDGVAWLRSGAPGATGERLLGDRAARALSGNGGAAFGGVRLERRGAGGA
jgi:nucleotide-binding universal stress UspA family protein